MLQNRHYTTIANPGPGRDTGTERNPLFRVLLMMNILLLDENGSEWMVGKWFTWADLYVVVVLQQFTKKMAGMDFESAKLTALSKKVYNIPKIKSYIDNRPDRPM